MSGLDSQRVLRQFDLSAKFGPCTNLTRKQRYDPGATIHGQLRIFLSCMHAASFDVKMQGLSYMHSSSSFTSLSPLQCWAATATGKCCCMLINLFLCSYLQTVKG